MRRSAAFIVGIALPTILWKLGGHLLSADILPCTVEELIRCLAKPISAIVYLDRFIIVTIPADGST
jgi:hypothetical protein